MELRVSGRIHQHADKASELEELLFADPPPSVVEPTWAAEHRRLKEAERARWLERQGAVRELLDNIPDFADPPPPIVLRATD